jgi:uncharacterized membrane protein YcaP (DUF421 family)
MSSLRSFDWRSVFVPSGSILEIFIRGSIAYLVILAFFRVFRRDSGSLGPADLLVVVLVADAVQNGMAGEYKSITEGILLVGTIFMWNFVLDWLGYRYAFVYWLLHSPPLLLVRDGRIQGRNLRSEMITREDLIEQLREQGVEKVSEVKRCYLEGDGRMSVIKYGPDEGPKHQQDDRTF